MFAQAILRALPLTAAAGLFFVLTSPAGARAVSVELDLLSLGPIEVGSVVRLDLVVRAEGAQPQIFDAAGAVLLWDPAHLRLIDNDQSYDSASEPYFSGFMPDGDGINEVTEPDTPADGTAYFQAFTFGQTYSAPPAPGHFVVTSFLFEALAPGVTTQVQLTPALGAFARTRALLFGSDVTGVVSGSLKIAIEPCCPGDFDCDDDVDIDDLIALIVQYGQCGGGGEPACTADMDGDADVDVDDLVELILAWGDC